MLIQIFITSTLLDFKAPIIHIVHMCLIHNVHVYKYMDLQAHYHSLVNQKEN
jgi:hypothetical protein